MKKIRSKEEFKKLFEILKVSYISEYIIEYPSLLDIDPYESKYYLDNKNEFDQLYATYGTKIRDRYVSDVYVALTKSKGYGLFTNKTIQVDSFIGVYIGVIKEEDEMVAFDDSGYDTDYAWDYPDEIDNFPILEINAKYSGNELRFVNHDLEPNIRVEHTIVDNMWYIFFVADRTINKDEEFSISYGEAYWDTDHRTLN
ncbi:MAG: SET domain-containing protein-lysine N-methyltransferase [Spirochaetaceae bacterium]